MKALITIGTDGGDWAPPRVVELMVTNGNRTGLGITNATEVRWRVDDAARITRAAIAMGSGDWSTRQWAHLDLGGITQVSAGQDVIIRPRVIAIDVELPLLMREEQRQLCKASTDLA
jgi:hypothetical protein